uniref:ASCH domain-containing protein n=1 Tax=Alexandrium catenella TaxID=2925 RepID=A0A7S1WSV0_ALECA|mmetsp:Transcript_86674/g.230283  ORF Transcript_86674/g.230283 Transcript_86674/m.230283 type:complete len:199 (+) Transcript_86674:76-672(+)
MAGGLRVLTLRGPELAYAILAGQKRVENRSWPVPRSVLEMGGWLALHVGSQPMTRYVRKHVERALDPARARNSSYAREAGGYPPRSSIVGLVRISGMHRLARGERRENPWALGPICWEIDRAIPIYPPITSVNGKLGIWLLTRATSICPRARRRLYSCLHKARLGIGRRGVRSNYPKPLMRIGRKASQSGSCKRAKRG